MINKKIIFTTIFLLACFFSQNLFGAYEIVIKVNGKNYTTIDLNNRINYLKSINKVTDNESYVKEDLFSALIFNQYALLNNYKIDIEIIDNFLTQINQKFGLSDEIIRENLKYDLQRQFYLEKFFNNKKINFNKIENISGHIYNYNIKFFTINKLNSTNINSIIKNIKFNDISEDINYLKNNNILYQFTDKIFQYDENIDVGIKKLINKNQISIYLEKDDYIIIGKIDRKFKNNINIEFSFKKVSLNQKINTRNINCNNLVSIDKNNLIEINDFKNIQINKVNLNILNKINFINDKVYLNNNEFIILCDIKYDIKNLEKLIIQNNIDKIVANIEKNFINDKSQEYNAKLYE